MTITYYTTDAQRVFAGAIEVSPYDSLPPGTLTPPPTTEGAQVAQWQGDHWEILDAYPEIPPAPVVVPDTRITKLAFRNRFTGLEKASMEFAALDNPAAPMPARMQAAALRANNADVAAATWIDLQRPDTRGGVQMLEAAGLLAPGRALEILDAEIQPEERPL